MSAWRAADGEGEISEQPSTARSGTSSTTHVHDADVGLVVDQSDGPDAGEPTRCRMTGSSCTSSEPSGAPAVVTDREVRTIRAVRVRRPPAAAAGHEDPDHPPSAPVTIDERRAQSPAHRTVSVERRHRAQPAQITLVRWHRGHPARRRRRRAARHRPRRPRGTLGTHCRSLRAGRTGSSQHGAGRTYRRAGHGLMPDGPLMNCQARSARDPPSGGRTSRSGCRGR